MQLDKMAQKHYDYLKKQFNMDADYFDEICKEDGDKLEKLLDFWT